MTCELVKADIKQKQLKNLTTCITSLPDTNQSPPSERGIAVVIAVTSGAKHKATNSFNLRLCIKLQYIPMINSPEHIDIEF